MILKCSYFLKVTRSKDVDLAKKQTSRTVFRCNVIGPPGSGKVSCLYGVVSYIIMSCRITSGGITQYDWSNECPQASTEFFGSFGGKTSACID